MIPPGVQRRGVAGYARPACSRPCRDSASIVTATSNTTPVIMNFTDDASANRSIPFEIDPMTSAPSNAAQTLPRPPTDSCRQ